MFHHGDAHGETPSPAHRHHHAHHHTHGTVDPALLTTQRGIAVVKWSLLGLLATALVQVVIVWLSSSVALLADTIHNLGDACTALPLWLAFVLTRRKPSTQFTYGYGRVEDLAGVAIVLIILGSALVAGYTALERLFHPQPWSTLAQWWVPH